jgi:hypothetical protein
MSIHFILILAFWILTTLLMSLFFFWIAPTNDGAWFFVPFFYLLLFCFVGHVLTNTRPGFTVDNVGQADVVSIEELPVQQLQYNGNTLDVVILNCNTTSFDVRCVSEYIMYTATPETKLYKITRRAYCWGLYGILENARVFDRVPDWYKSESTAAEN